MEFETYQKHLSDLKVFYDTEEKLKNLVKIRAYKKGTDKNSSKLMKSYKHELLQNFWRTSVRISPDSAGLKTGDDYIIEAENTKIYVLDKLNPGDLLFSDQIVVPFWLPA